MGFRIIQSVPTASMVPLYLETPAIRPLPSKQDYSLATIQFITTPWFIVLEYL